MIRSLTSMLAGTALLLGPPSLYAQGYPKSAINMVIPLAAGDATDIAARTLAEELSKLLKVPVVAVNKPGAGGALATESVVKANKDGYTILLSTNASMNFRRVIDPETAKYDPEKDFVALGMTTRTPSVLAIRSDAPFKTFPEMVEYAEKNPGKVRVGTAGVGSIGDFTVATINSLTAAGITMVPFTGASPAVTALRGGHLEGITLALGVVSSHLKSGAMKGVVISTKFPGLPEIPTLTELGYRQKLFGIWMGFFAPAGVPAEVVNTLVPAIEKVAKMPAIASKLLSMGMVQEYATPEALVDEMREEYRSLEAIAKKSGMMK